MPSRFFFFQAEDGMRDADVTGVQTCALPISYFAELHIYRGDTIIQIDARPSDSIALALRLKAPILTSETLLELTSVDTSEGAIQPGSGGSPLDADTLKSYLQNLDPEDFGKFTP